MKNLNFGGFRKIFVLKLGFAFCKKKAQKLHGLCFGDLTERSIGSFCTQNNFFYSWEFLPRGGGGGEVPFKSYISMCCAKEYGVLAILV